MIAVAIIGILAAVAYPSYTNSIIKGNRSVAKAFMMEVGQKEQQILLDRRAYVAVAGNTDFSGSIGVPIPKEVSNFYDVVVTLPAGSPPHFLITATPKSDTRQKDDGVLTLTETGAKTGKW